jgi:hypothetical protein
MPEVRAGCDEKSQRRQTANFPTFESANSRMNVQNFNAKDTSSVPIFKREDFSNGRTSGGRSVSIACLRTQATECSF